MPGQNRNEAFLGSQRFLIGSSRRRRGGRGALEGLWCVVVRCARGLIPTVQTNGQALGAPGGASQPPAPRSKPSGVERFSGQLFRSVPGRNESAKGRGPAREGPRPLLPRSATRSRKGGGVQRQPAMPCSGVTQSSLMLFLYQSHIRPERARYGLDRETPAYDFRGHQHEGP